MHLADLHGTISRSARPISDQTITSCPVTLVATHWDGRPVNACWLFTRGQAMPLVRGKVGIHSYGTTTGHLNARRPSATFSV